MPTTKYHLSPADAKDLLRCFDSQGRLIGLSGMEAKGGGRYLHYKISEWNNGLQQSMKQATNPDFYRFLVDELLKLRFSISPVSVSGRAIYFTQEAIDRTQSLVNEVFKN